MSQTTEHALKKGEVADTGARVLLVWQAFEHNLDFKAYRLIEMGDGTFQYENDANSLPTANIAEAELLMDGYVKWDTCCNVYIGDRQVMMHFCDPEDVDCISAALRLAYKVAAERIPTWNG